MVHEAVVEVPDDAEPGEIVELMYAKVPDSQYEEDDGDIDHTEGSAEDAVPHAVADCMIVRDEAGCLALVGSNCARSEE